MNLGGRYGAPNSAPGPFRISAVVGYESRANDIVYCPPIKPIIENEEESTAVVYFGGDVQVFTIVQSFLVWFV